MAICTVKDKKTIFHLFQACHNTMILSCLQDCMGVAYSDCEKPPISAQISVGDFICFAGEVNESLVRNRPENLRSEFSILVPQNEQWQKAIEHIHKENATRIIRHSTRKQPDIFNTKKLRQFVSQLEAPYTLKLIDQTLYSEIISSSWAVDLCSNFNNYSDFAEHGLGVVVLKNGEIVSGASSYTYYKGGIEIEIDTRENERRKGLALACGARLILECLERNLYPSWDAHDKRSLMLAQKLGYQFDEEYIAYEVVWS
jgi:hypothetical protein